MENISKLCLFSSLILMVMAVNQDHFVLISVKPILAPPKTVQFNVKANRESPNVYAINGNMTVLKDLFSDTQISGYLYRSFIGNNDFVLTPYKIDKQSLKTFFNTGYKTIFMDNVKECSNLPKFDGEWEPPLKKNVYVINNCKANATALPDFLINGYYKFALHAHHENNVYSLEIVFKVARTRV